MCTANAKMDAGRGCDRTVAGRHCEIGLGAYCFTDKFDDIVYWLCMLVIRFFVVCKLYKIQKIVYPKRHRSYLLVIQYDATEGSHREWVGKAGATCHICQAGIRRRPRSGR